MGLATDAELKKAADKLQSQINQISKWIASANTAFKNHVQHITRIDQAVANNQTRIKNVESEIFNLKKTDQEMKAVINALKALPTPEAQT